MDKFLNRQLELLVKTVDEYRKGKLSLNVFINQIDGLRHAVGDRDFSNKLLEPIWDIEQINGVLLDERRSATPNEVEMIEASVEKITLLTTQFSKIGNIK